MSVFGKKNDEVAKMASERHILTYRGVKVDPDGRRYIDLTTDALEELGVLALVPLYAVRDDQTPNASVSTATSKVATVTASEMRDLLSEAEANLADSSDSSTERRVASSSAVKASSSSKVRGSKSCSSKSGFMSGKSTMQGLAIAVNVFLAILAVANALTLRDLAAAWALFVVSAFMSGFAIASYRRKGGSTWTS